MLTNEIATNQNSVLNLDSLNDKQKEAVLTTEGPLLVLAGAGTGKTTVLTTRIANILSKGTFPSQILAVTFTNKASREMRERISNQVGQISDGIWLGTFHSICAKILRRHANLVGLQSDFTIIDTSDKIRLLKQIITDNNIEEKKWPAKRLAYIISHFKDKGYNHINIKEKDNDFEFEGGAINLYKQYQNRLIKLNSVDFDDLLLHNLTILIGNADILEQYQRRFKYILVDEYQDTNASQYMWLRLLTQSSNNICCVGDDDQSIYGWRGAEVGNILRFEKDYPDAKVIKLERNYRSTKNILLAASSLISNNKSRLGKTLWTEGQQGSQVKLVAIWDDEQEAKYIADEIESCLLNNKCSANQIAILVRAGFQTRSFEECFIMRSIGYKVVGGLRFYERLEIRDVIAYLRLVANKNDDLSLERIINLPKRGIGKTTISKIRDYANLNAISMFDAISLVVSEKIVTASIANNLLQFVENFDKFSSLVDSMKLDELTNNVLNESGYIQMWKNEKTNESQGRIENIKELILSLEEFDSLDNFLEHVSLVADKDMLESEDLVSIMTLHAAKGLEFDNVFLPGWEEGLFPHQRSLDETGINGLEEERRLAYVGITRAKKDATICFAANRRVYGQYQSNIPSRFIDELPAEATEIINLNNGLKFSQNNSKESNFTQPNSQSKFQDGSRIFHQKFGYGQILNVENDKLDIQFEKSGRKKIIASFVETV